MRDEPADEVTAVALRLARASVGLCGGLAIGILIGLVLVWAGLF